MRGRGKGGGVGGERDWLITAATCSRGREEDDGGISVQTERPAESLIRMAYSLRVNSSPREMVGRKRRGERKEKKYYPRGEGRG